MLFSNLQRNGLQLAEKKYYKTPKNTIIELRSSLMNLFVETDTIRRDGRPPSMEAPSAAPAFAKLLQAFAILKPLTPFRIVLRIPNNSMLNKKIPKSNRDFSSETDTIRTCDPHLRRVML